MKKVSDGFKTNIKLTGRQLDFKMYLYNNYNLATESGDLLLTEDNINLASEQFKLDDKTEIGSESIYSASINRNGSLFKSLMKELDFEADKDFSIGSMVDFQFGLLVNGEYEYIDYGNYVIYSKEYKLDTETWSYVCYDRMLYYMIKYSKLDITYPITIRDYIENLAHKMTLGFADSETEFTNYNELINEDLFKDKDYTYRDILDKLSEITASNIMLDEQDRLKIGYPSETDTSLDESDLKDINVAFGENFGVINRISITDSDVDVEYYAEDSDSIAKNGKTQINIVDNEFTTNGNQTKMAQAILKRLNGFYYSINDFSTIGTCIYDYLDMFNVNAKGNTYKCLVLNDEIDFSQGIKESFYTEKLENSEKESDNYQTSTMSSKTVTFKINQQEGKIESKVEKDGVISAINQSPEEVQINANKIRLEGIVTANDGFSIDLEGNMSCNNANINGDIITPTGVLTNLQYLSSGQFGNANLIGFGEVMTNGTATYGRLGLSAYVYIPEFFTIKEVYATLYMTRTHYYAYYNDASGYPNNVEGTGYARNIRLYCQTGDYATTYYNSYGAMEVNYDNTGTEVSNAFGSNGYTLTSNGQNSDVWESITTDNLASVLDLQKGLNILTCKTSATTTSNSNDNRDALSKTGVGLLVVNIIGYTNKV